MLPTCRAMTHCSQGHQNSTGDRFCRLCGEPLAAIAGPAAAIATVGWRYRIRRELGQGGFGRTYLAEDTNRFNETCVLKEFAPQVEGTPALEKAEELFAREAGVLYRLQHPQIPRFRELFRAEWQGRGRLFLVQEYIQGPTYQELLRDRQQQGQAFSEAEVIQLLLQLLPVLSYLHAIGMIHRDISPDNLILRSSDRLPVLIDFGGVKQIAATVASQVNASSKVTRLGKLGYAPAEQINTGEAYPHSDLYALAATVLVLLTGQEPQALLKDDRRQWHKLVKLSRSRVSVLDRMLSPLPTNRYQSANDVLRALGATPSQTIAHSPIVPSAIVPPAPAVPAGSQFSAAYPNTIALAPVAPVATPVKPIAPPVRVSPPTDPPRSRTVAGFLVFMTLLLLAGASIGGFWAVNQRGIQPFWKAPQPTKSKALRPVSETAFPAAERSRKQTLGDRREQLGVNEGFLIGLIDEAFFAKHPIGRALTKDPKDASLRAEWDTLAGQYLDRVQSLSEDARSRLGSYSEADLDKRRAIVNQLLSSRAFNDLTDAQFFTRFPDESRDPSLLTKPLGQVWQAIATDQLKAVQTGTALEQIKLSGNSQQMNGTLKPGAGKVFVVNLSSDQTLRLKLQAPRKSTQLSIYPPTSRSTPLLEDATDMQWSGKLPETGPYEIVIVSTRSNAIPYAIDLAIEAAP